MEHAPMTVAGRKWRYPFPIMEVGDTFEAPNNLGRCTHGGHRRQNSIAAAAWRYCQVYAPAQRFEARTIGETVICKRVA